MPEYHSFEEAKEALHLARIEAKEARKQHGKDSVEAQKALAECSAIQTVMDRFWPGRK
jgi:hypothetical protein